ncbi:hypothetical protein [Streptomyces sp. WMMC905]|uniref:hypothetical protein n=1 Tax=Streptomyces sp. WMMC905 TaxID=3404123 RepID=UPI003B945181
MGRTGVPRGAVVSRRRTPSPAAAAPWAAASLVLLLLTAVVARLPWAGDLGLHAAVVERLRHSLTDPGNPLVDADTPSPYYSPWTVLLGVAARLGDPSVFVVLRMGALIALALLATGVWAYTRALGARGAAPATALLCLLLLWGTAPFAWSGFLGLNSLALTVSYPSVLALGLAFHLWAWLTRVLRADGRPSASTWAGIGVLWAVILLCHQFSGVVATLGALATLLASPARGALRRRLALLALGVAAGLLTLWSWPYYDFFALSAVGQGLEEVHRPLYRELPARYWLVLVGVAALAARLRRDRRDPLALFFTAGVAMVAAGALSGHWSWGRAMPAAVIPAQLAVAWEVGGATRHAARIAWATVLAGALALGAWAQSGTLGYVVDRRSLPEAVAARHREPWSGYHWITPWVRYGDVVMARDPMPSRRIPAYGGYTVAPGYPDFFLPDEEARREAVRRYFAEGTSPEARRSLLRAWGVRWVVDHAPGDRRSEGLSEIARGPGGEVLYRVLPVT